MISPETLRRYPLFAGFAAAHLKELAMLGEEITLPAGKWLFRDGEAATAVYLLVEGTVELHIDDSSVRDGTLVAGELVAGEVVGWSGMVQPRRYSLGAFALQEARLVRLNAQGLDDFIAAHSDVGLLLMRRIAQVIGERLAKLRGQLVSLASG